VSPPACHRDEIAALGCLARGAVPGYSGLPLIAAVDLTVEAAVHRPSRIRRGGAALAAALVASACAASDGVDPAPLPVGAATTAPTNSAATPSPVTPQVSAEEAMSIALDAVGGGDVVDTDADEFEVEIQVWEITVVGPDGVRREVSVDMTSGNVMGNEPD
jgi:ABC-type glycerol-3-phosphate transport system substrate-binding protein